MFEASAVNFRITYFVSLQRSRLVLRLNPCDTKGETTGLGFILYSAVFPSRRARQNARPACQPELLYVPTIEKAVEEC